MGPVTVDMRGEPIIWLFLYGSCTGRQNLAQISVELMVHKLTDLKL